MKICEKITKDLQRDVANFGNIPYNMYRPFFRYSIFLCDISKPRLHDGGSELLQGSKEVRAVIDILSLN